LSSYIVSVYREL